MTRRPLLVLVATTASCATFLGLPERRASDDPIRVPHQTHARAKVPCIACHENVYDATTLTGELLPPESKCLECHREKKETGQCAFCHTDVRRAGPWPRTDEPHLRLSHAKHIDLVNEDCSRCHARLPDRAAPVGTITPTMNACRSCHVHEQEYRDGRCDACHTDLTRYPLKPVSDFAHNANFGRDHARAARAAAAKCATCHDATYCADCHATTTHPRIELKLPERVDADFIHRNDFLGRHSVEAHADPASCRRCHGTSFCTGCHESENLTPRAASPRNPHPGGWSLPGSADFHGAAARRDIASCAACHDDGPRSICIDCHRVGGPGGDPHPASWAGRHSLVEARSNATCLYCHR
jgi:hypothetical protein